MFLFHLFFSVSVIVVFTSAWWSVSRCACTICTRRAVPRSCTSAPGPLSSSGSHPPALQHIPSGLQHAGAGRRDCFTFVSTGGALSREACSHLRW